MPTVTPNLAISYLQHCQLFYCVTLATALPTFDYSVHAYCNPQSSSILSTALSTFLLRYPSYCVTLFYSVSAYCNTQSSCTLSTALTLRCRIFYHCVTVRCYALNIVYCVALLYPIYCVDTALSTFYYCLLLCSCLLRYPN